MSQVELVGTVPAAENLERSEAAVGRIMFQLFVT